MSPPERPEKHGDIDEPEEAATSIRPENVRAVRLGHGANCSSVGSVIDTLFLASAVGGAIFAAVCAAMRDEGVHVVGRASSGDHDEAKEPEENDP